MIFLKSLGPMKIIIFFFFCFIFILHIIIARIPYILQIVCLSRKGYFNIKASLCHIVYVFKIISVHVIIIFYKAFSKRK
jgi:hypothetical protein